jgi:hypothetical protein
LLATARRNGAGTSFSVYRLERSNLLAQSLDLLVTPRLGVAHVVELNERGSFGIHRCFPRCALPLERLTPERAAENELLLGRRAYGSAPTATQ